MIPLRLRLTNFRSFTKTQEFVFPEGPGLFFMWGENRAEPRLGRNGAGKSTVWEALTVLFHNKTSRGLRAGAVSTWGIGKGTVIEFDYLMHTFGAVYTCRRTWGPISWTLVDEFGVQHDLSKDESNPVTEALRLGFDAYLNSVLIPQNAGAMFLDLKPEPKATLFSDIMGLERWVSYAGKASKLTIEWDRKQHDLERLLSGIDGELKAMGSGDDLAGKAAAWQAEIDGERAQLRERYAAALESMRKLSAELHDADAHERDLLVAALSDEQEASKKNRDAADAHAEAKRETDRARMTLERVIADMEALAKHEHCPLCGQGLEGHRDGGDLSLTLAEDAVADAREWEDRTGQVLEQAAAALNRATKAVDVARQGVTRADSTTRLVRRDRERVGHDLDAMEAKDDDLAATKNPWLDMLERRTAEIERLGADRVTCLSQIDAADSKRILFKNWSGWCKDIRLSLIAEALDQLEIEAAAQAHALGLVDWRLQFDVDREGKNGQLQRGFLTTVISPHNDEPVPWEAWSGGESQRLRLSGQMGLSNLIRRRTGASLAIEVWDEPTQWVGEEGVIDLLEALRERSEREGLQIWVVDHRSFGYGGFNGSIGVIKERDGSRFAEASYKSAYVHATVDATRGSVDDDRRRRTNSRK